MQSIPPKLQEALDHERSNCVEYPVTDSNFYKTPDYSKQDAPGKLLKLEKHTNTSKYRLPPATAMSRFIYLSETIGGTVVPVSAYVLWPYAPKVQPDGGYAVVAWAHGTSAIRENGAVSNHKNLWQHFYGPYQLVMSGYVVVATDYQGLGVSVDIDGNPIIMPWLVTSSQATDVAYSLLAAKEAFSSLSGDWIAVGHSQGGGAVWAVAERQAIKPIFNCLGSVSVSPATRLWDEPDPIGPIIGVTVSSSMKYILTDLDLDTFMTKEGRELAKLNVDTGGGVGSGLMILLGPQLMKPGWREHPRLKEYLEKGCAGGRALGCPTLVLHGDADVLISTGSVEKSFDATMKAAPDSRLLLHWLPKVGHDSALTAGSRIWLDWVADRFAERPLSKDMSGKKLTVKPALPFQAYGMDQTWILSTKTQPFQTP